KDVIASSGVPGAKTFRGHTEHLQARLGAREVVMAFWSSKLTIALVTTHFALADVFGAVRLEGVARATFWLPDLLVKLRPNREPRVVVAGLNPHAGENGLLGDEERTKIAPGIRRARSRLSKAGLHAKLEGPIGAESAFRLAVHGVYD